ncbi:hypothetical protein SEA_JAYCOOKIE_2 [Arthrobacter phage JayCookie]|uniref:Uncharacterized protein n=2 Tax=Klausavirus princesstrina TaxID=1984784 RepID=A0A0U4KQ40_9CAUD|nr:Rnase E [Arthrobacter phage PrincessTrina]ALY09848.1 hypothetical protein PRINCESSTRINA_2 [Arthrobacter phage PrincessTrina]ASZ73213.1 hypothetical protein SEA_JAYCOOKIE_2 [Arthrobacter phage JayCookie]
MTFEMGAADVPKVTKELEAAMKARKRRKQRKDGGKAGPSALRRRDRIIEALRMRRDEGKTWEQVAKLNGWNSKQACYEACMNYLEKHDKAEIDLYRDVEYSRLEKAAEVVMGIIESDNAVLDMMMDETSIDMLDGYQRNKYLDEVADRVGKNVELKLKAVDRLVNVGTRTGKILGYDAPTKLEGNGMGGDITVTFAGAMAKPAEMAEPEIIVEPEKR